MTKSPAVSVLMSVRNGAPWVRNAVESVLGQSAGDLELIVVDDGSTDDTGAVLASFTDPRLRVERRGPEGLTRALNRALALARAAAEIVVARGKKTVRIDMRKSAPDDAELLGLLLGPTGNLRAPTIRRGKTLLVGFDAESYRRVLGPRTASGA